VTAFLFVRLLGVNALDQSETGRRARKPKKEAVR
jgi:hypothetical protein